MDMIQILSRIKKKGLLPPAPQLSLKKVANSRSNCCASAWVHPHPHELIQPLQISFRKQNSYELRTLHLKRILLILLCRYSI